MSKTIQEYAAQMNRQAADALLAAALALPENKRNWKPNDRGRSATDQVAECALINEIVTRMIETHVWSSDDWGDKKAALMADWDALQAALKANTEKLVAAILAVPDDSLSTAVELPWKTSTLENVLGLCVWNMTYHEGQINYIATLLI